MDGLEYLTPADYEIAKQNGISYSIVYARVYRYGWDIQRAITEPLRQEGPWKAYKDQALANGVSYGMFMKRLHQGLSPEEAIRQGRSLGGRKLNPRISEEMYEKAALNGIGRNTLKCRIFQLRWSDERALTEPVHLNKSSKK